METGKKEAVEKLQTLIQQSNMTVYTILRHVSRSGMTRVISPIVIIDNKPLDISYLTSKALGWKQDKNHYGVKVSGCGMDMGFHLVYQLSHAVFGNGYVVTQKWL